MDGDEEVLAAAIREAQEELGAELSPDDLEVIGVMHRRSDDERVSFFVLAHHWGGELANQEPDKCVALDRFDLDRLPSNTVPDIRQALDNYHHHGCGLWLHRFGWPSEWLSAR
jgi:8-oxo-dGTP diphosphatase